MKPLFALALLLLLLGGCAGTDAYMDNPECRQQVYANPEVGARIARDTSSHYSPLGEESLADMKKRVYVDCLRARGLAPKGGVEPVKRFY
jgi:hypothetical protein